MCGHAGIAYADPRRAPTRELLGRMAGTLVHRGPDDEGIEIAGSVGMAFRRLSIIDLEGGHQPLQNESGDIWLVANGEVYNHHELRRDLIARGHRFRTASDCETLVHLYEEYGSEFPRHLVGMISFALLDRREGRTRIVLGRDRLGIKPLYYAETPNGLIWGSEPKALLEAGELDRELRAPALLDYLVQGYVGGEEAAWAGMRRLRPGCLLSWEPGGPAHIQRYWDLPTDELRGPAAKEEILEWLDRVVVDRLEAEVTLGAFLSGGIDSSAVVTSMARAQERAVLACSVGFHEKSHDELEIARATAKALGAEHHTARLEADPSLAVEVLPWFYDEPLADPSTVPTYLVSRMAREHVTVALSGDGGDETFAGYRRYVHDQAENRLRARLGRTGVKLAAGLGSVYPKLDWAPRVFRGRTFLTNVGSDPARAYYRSVTQLERAEALDLLNPDVARSLAEHDPFEAFSSHYARPAIDDPLYRAQYADFHTYLPDQILTKVDRASMGVSLEVRVPILDHRFVERFAHLPASSKVQGGRGKHAFREALRSRLSTEVLDGKKRGFDTPLDRWLRGPLAPALEEALRGLPEEWFQPRVLKSRFDEHQSGARDHGRLLWSLLVLEHWRRRHAVQRLSA